MWYANCCKVLKKRSLLMWCQSVWEMGKLTLGCFSQVPPTATHIISESLEPADVRVSCWWPVTDGSKLVKISHPVEVEVKPGKCPGHWGLMGPVWKCFLSCSCCVWEHSASVSDLMAAMFKCCLKRVIVENVIHERKRNKPGDSSVSVKRTLWKEPHWLCSTV